MTSARPGAWTWASAAAVLVLALLVLVVRGGSGDPTGVHGALDIARDTGRFADRSDAADALALVAQLLQQEAARCVERHGGDAPACVARAQGFAFAQTAAVASLQCTPAGLEEIRRLAVDVLTAIDSVAPGHPGPVPSLPTVPRC